MNLNNGGPFSSVVADECLLTYSRHGAPGEDVTLI